MRRGNFSDFAASVGLLSVLLVGSTASAQTSPGSIPLSPSTTTGTASATNGGTTTTIAPAPVGTSGKTLSAPTTTITSNGTSFTVGGTGNTDPFMFYELTAANTTTVDQFFAFIFEIPITMPEVTDPFSSLELTLTDGNGDGITLGQPTAADFDPPQFAASNGEVQYLPVQRTILGTLSDDTESIEFLFDNEFGGLINVDGGSFFSPETATYFFSFPDIPALASLEGVTALPDFRALGVVVGFWLSPQDSATFSGYTQTTPRRLVPLPPSLLTSLIALGYFGFRKGPRLLRRSGETRGVNV